MLLRPCARAQKAAPSSKEESFSVQYFLFSVKSQNQNQQCINEMFPCGAKAIYILFICAREIHCCPQSVEI